MYSHKNKFIDLYLVPNFVLPTYTVTHYATKQQNSGYYQTAEDELDIDTRRLVLVAMLLLLM